MQASVLLIAVLLLTPGLARAAVTVTERIDTYTVTGATIGEVVRSMLRNGPFVYAIGRKGLGKADFRHRLRVSTERENGRCRVSQVALNLRIRLTVPRLSSRAGLNRSHRARWQAIERMIVSHEKRHAAFYRQFARELVRDVKRLAPQANCAALHREKRRVEEAALKRDRRRNRAFDRRSYGGFNKRLKRLSR